MSRCGPTVLRPYRPMSQNSRSRLGPLGFEPKTPCLKGRRHLSKITTNRRESGVSAWQWNVGFDVLVVVGLIGVGATRLIQHPDWTDLLNLLGFGVGSGAQFWVSWKYVLTAAVVLFLLSIVLAFASPGAINYALNSSLGLGLSAWGGSEQERRKRTTE
jgi:hypothetical protein